MRTKQSLINSLNKLKSEGNPNAVPPTEKAVRHYIKTSGILKVSTNIHSDEATIPEEYHYHPCLPQNEIEDSMLRAITNVVRSTHHHLRRQIGPGRYSPALSRIVFCLRERQSNTALRLLELGTVESTTTTSLRGKLTASQISTWLKEHLDRNYVSANSILCNFPVIKNAICCGPVFFDPGESIYPFLYCNVSMIDIKFILNFGSGYYRLSLSIKSAYSEDMGPLLNLPVTDLPSHPLLETPPGCAIMPALLYPVAS